MNVFISFFFLSIDYESISLFLVNCRWNARMNKNIIYFWSWILSGCRTTPINSYLCMNFTLHIFPVLVFLLGFIFLLLFFIFFLYFFFFLNFLSSSWSKFRRKGNFENFTKSKFFLFFILFFDWNLNLNLKSVHSNCIFLLTYLPNYHFGKFALCFQFSSLANKQMLERKKKKLKRKKIIKNWRESTFQHSVPNGDM